MKVLVMGGTQFNGLALVRELVRAGHDVTVCNRGKSPAVLPNGVRRLVADRTQPASVRAALAGEDWDCVHDVSAYRPEDVKLMTEILRGRTGHYVFASSTVIYAPSDRLPITEDHPVDRTEAQNGYGLNKILCEDHLVREYREHGFPATIAAFSMVFGPHNIIPEREQRMFVRLLRGRKVLVPGDGTTIGQVGYVEDEARALRMMMGHPKTFGRRYNLTGADVYTEEGYVDTFAEVMGVPAQKVFVPAALMDDLYAGRVSVGGGSHAVRADTRAQTSEREARLWQLQRLIQKLAPHLHGWNRNVFFSVRRLEDDIGWRAESSFRGAVEQTWEWMQREGLERTLEFDFGFEDELLARVG